MAGFYCLSWPAANALLCALTIPPCIAQDATERPVAMDEAQPEVSRQEWLDRVQEARRRAKEAALDRHPERYTPPPEDAARIASERALNDDSLQPGDIVSTDGGLFISWTARPAAEERRLRPIAEPITGF
jgi:hypothetical protein